MAFGEQQQPPNADSVTQSRRRLIQPEFAILDGFGSISDNVNPAIPANFTGVVCYNTSIPLAALDDATIEFYLGGALAASLTTTDRLGDVTFTSPFSPSGGILGAVNTPWDIFIGSGTVVGGLTPFSLFSHGSVIYIAADGSMAQLSPGTADALLRTSGSGAAPTWQDPATTSEIADITTGSESAGSSDTWARGDHVHHISGAIPTVVLKTADTSTSSDNSLNDDADLHFTVEANRTYTVDVMLHLTSTDLAAGDFQCSWAVPTGATGEFSGIAVNDSNSMTVYGVQTTITSALAFAFTGTTTAVLLHLMAVIAISSTAGTVTFRHAQNTSDATAYVLRERSRLIVY